MRLCSVIVTVCSEPVRVLKLAEGQPKQKWTLKNNFKFDAELKGILKTRLLILITLILYEVNHTTDNTIYWALQVLKEY